MHLHLVMALLLPCRAGIQGTHSRGSAGRLRQRPAQSDAPPAGVLHRGWAGAPQLTSGISSTAAAAAQPPQQVSLPAHPNNHATLLRLEACDGLKRGGSWHLRSSLYCAGKALLAWRAQTAAIAAFHAAAALPALLLPCFPRQRRASTALPPAG